MNKRMQRNKRMISSQRRYQDGYNKGYDNGYDNGYTLGFQEGYRSSAPFSGTSIIIPTYNQRDYLQKCIESIQQYTPDAHEIIVVDNASQDGTVQYLQSLAGQVRYMSCSENFGFAGAVNQGLAMASGKTLLILNNDTIVTQNWLSNLLTCVNADPQIGLVGPVTNYISGEQLIATSYTDLEGMHEFARAYNVSEPARWVNTGRMTGFCVMMRREVFDRIGYLDEGFVVGNCEDDDYSFRAQLLGLHLIIAADTFIHHFGSVSMKSLGENFDQIYSENLTFYSNKWEYAHVLPNERVQGVTPNLRMTDYYPSHVLIHDATGQCYWIEGGLRYMVSDLSELASTRVSYVELTNWPLAGTIDKETVYAKLSHLSAWSGDVRTEGLWVQTPDGRTYQYERGAVRRCISRQSVERWNPGLRPVFMINSEQMIGIPEGLPIIPPPTIRSGSL